MSARNSFALKPFPIYFVFRRWTEAKETRRPSGVGKDAGRRRGDRRRDGSLTRNRVARNVRNDQMSGKPLSLNRRQALKGVVAGAAALSLPGAFTTALAAPKTIKIGLVQPTTGPLAFFTEHIPFVLDQVKKTLGGSIDVNGTKHPYEIVIKDSQSSPNRAAEVTQELILQDEVDLVATFATPETV